MFKKKKPENILNNEQLEEFKEFLKTKDNKEKPDKPQVIAVDEKGIQHKPEEINIPEPEDDEDIDSMFIQELTEVVQKYTDRIELIKIYGYLNYFASHWIQLENE